MRAMEYADALWHTTAGDVLSQSFRTRSVWIGRQAAVLCDQDTSTVTASDYAGILTYQATRMCSATVFKLLQPLEACEIEDLDCPRTFSVEYS